MQNSRLFRRLQRPAVWAAAASIIVVGCGGPSGRRESASATANGPEWFTDRAHETGLDFIHFNGATGKFYQPEIMPPGVALFDYDNDGDLDAYLVQGRMLDEGKPLVAMPASPLKGRLFRNDLEVDPDGRRTMRFVDVSDQTGIVATGYGMGVAVGDIDNDGCNDLFLTGFGPSQLFHNSCHGTFTDISKPSRIDDAGWTVSASFFDYDRDGWLDLYVGHYLEYDLKTGRPCLGSSGRPDYCLPKEYKAQASRLYHNNHNRTFTDVTAAAGINEFGPALGIATADFNGDGWIDFYVANDGRENQLWMNQHHGRFKNNALLSGSALPEHGKAEASMGVDAGDFDNDGDEDLFMTELTGEGNNLYVNDGTGIFEDRGMQSGLGPQSLVYTGFGTVWFDADNDGWLDLLTVNGKVEGSESSMLQQGKQLFRNLGNGRFEDATAQAGAVFRVPEVSRGAAFGDVDNDGDIDVLIGNDGGPARLLINNAAGANHWIGMRLVGAATPRDMVGARVAVLQKGGPARWRRARADASYASANDPRVVVGLGAAAAASSVRVIWPSGRTEEWADIPADRYTTIREGTGK